MTVLNVVSLVGAGSARPSPPVVILLSQRAGKPRPYKACHLGSHFSKPKHQTCLSLYSYHKHMYSHHTKPSIPQVVFVSFQESQKRLSPSFERLTPLVLIFSATILIVLTFISHIFDTNIILVSIFAMSTRDKRF